MGFAPTWFRQVSPLLHKTTLTTAFDAYPDDDADPGIFNGFLPLEDGAVTRMLRDQAALAVCDL